MRRGLAAYRPKPGGHGGARRPPIVSTLRHNEQARVRLHEKGILRKQAAWLDIANRHARLNTVDRKEPCPDQFQALIEDSMGPFGVP